MANSLEEALKSFMERNLRGSTTPPAPLIKKGLDLLIPPPAPAPEAPFMEKANWALSMPGVMQGMSVPQLPKMAGLGLSKLAPNQVAQRARATGPEVPQLFRAEKLADDAAEQQNLRDMLTAMGLDTRKTLTKADLLKSAEAGRVGHPEEVVRTASQIRGNRDEITRLTMELRNPDLPDVQRKDISKKIEELYHGMSVSLGKRVTAGTEFGRAVNAYKYIALGNKDPLYWYTAARQAAGKNAPPEMMQTVDKLLKSGDTDNLALYVASLRKPTKAMWMVKLLKAGMLSNPKSHIKNIAGNTGAVVLEHLSDIPAAAFDRMLPGGRTTFLSPKIIRKELEALPGAMVHAKRIFQHGEIPETKLDLTRATAGVPIEGRMRPAAEALDTAANYIFRALGAEDVLFRDPAYAKSLTEQAMAKAHNAGKRGKDLWAEVEGILKSPSEEMRKIAEADAAYQVFQNPNALSEGLSSMVRRAGPAGKIALELTMPFRTTPANLINFALDYSPIGLLKTAYKDLVINREMEPLLRKRYMVKGLGRSVTGTSLMALGVEAYRQGLAVAGLPKSQSESSLRTLKRQRNFSVKVGDQWVDVTGLQPASAVFMAGVQAGQSHKEGSGGAGMAGAMVGSQAGMALQSPFLQGPENIIEFLQDPTSTAERTFSGYLGMAVPSAVAALARGFGGELKRPEGIAQRGLQSRIPGAASELEPELDALGRTIKIPGPLSQMFNPVPGQREDKSTAVKVLSEVNWAPVDEKKVDVKVNRDEEKRLVGDERTKFERERGKERLSRLDRLGEMTLFWSLPPERQKKLVKKAVQDADEAAEMRYRLKFLKGVSK